MLVLSRKNKEGILLGDDIVISVIGISGNRVRLGIQAPKNVKVMRKELALKIERESDAQIGTIPEPQRCSYGPVRDSRTTELDNQEECHRTCDADKGGSPS